VEEAPVPKSYFSDRGVARAFYVALTGHIGKRREEMVGAFIKPGNMHRFRHGGDWSNPNAPQAFGGHMEQHGFTAETSNESIRQNDLEAISRLVDTVAVEMGRQFTQMFYRTTSDACDSVGNVVDAQASGSLAEAFLEVLEKIEFMADRNGKVSMPELHVGSDVGSRLLALKDNAPPGFNEKVEALQARKIQEAKAREVERKAKFVGYGVEA